MSQRNFTVYKSSAGSGKTYTLVKEYLNLILKSKRPDRYKHILAITFTNKAANEMKERVMSALHKLSIDSYNDDYDPKFFSDIQQYVDIDGDTLRERAGKVLDSILHNYADLSISTIDKFVHKVLRSFARDLRLSVDFEVELDEGNVLQQVVDLLISKIGSEDSITDLLLEFAEHKIEEDKSWQIDQSLMDTVWTITKEGSNDHLERLKNFSIKDFREIAKELQKQVAVFENVIKQQGISAFELIQSNGIDLNSFSRGASGIGNYFRKIASGDMESLTPNSYVIKTIEEDNWYSGKADDTQKSAIDGIREKLVELYQEIQQTVEKDYKKYNAQKLLLDNIYSVSVLNELDKILQEVKNERNLLLISDFNKKIGEVIVKEPAPFIYERLGERFRNYLLDEFQDTSVMQWQNLLPLLENSLATGNFTLIVGDSKQAIYRFRSGEVEQFVQLPNVYKHQNNPIVISHEQTLKRNYQEEVLTTNYRSGKDIVAFNNMFFSALIEKETDDIKEIYRGLEQKVKHEDKSGFINVSFLIEEKEDLDNVYCERIFQAINEALKDGYSYSDIAVLTSKKKHGNLIANYLNDKRFPVISPESLLLGENPKVRFLISILEYLVNPDDEAAKLFALEFILKREDVTSFQEAHYKHSYSSESGKKHINLKQFFISKGIDISDNQLSQQPLFNIIEKLIVTFELDNPADAYIQFFQEAVYNFATKKGNDIYKFLDWWETKKNKLSVQTAEGIKAINIMTIHKSKGLQFPVVILPYLNWKIDGEKGKGNAWVDLTGEAGELPTGLVKLSKRIKETSFTAYYEEENKKLLLDAINLLYVAFTRPEDRLYIFSDLSPKKQKADDSTVRKFLLPILESMDGWNDETKSFTKGKKTNVKQIEVIDDDIYQIDHPIHQDASQSKLQISFQAPEVWGDGTTDDKRQYGNLIHKIFASIKTEEDIDTTLSKYLLEGLISSEELQLLEEKIKTLIQLPEVNSWFQKGLTIETEVDILDEKGGLHRPDRIIIEGDKATVVDFKTGSESEAHVKQIRTYGTRLLEIGFKSVDKYLLYTEDHTVKRVE